MDDTLLIRAYRRFSDSHDCFLDGILCNPELREPFLELLDEPMGDFPEAHILNRLLYLRKRGQLARKKRR